MGVFTNTNNRDVLGNLEPEGSELTIVPLEIRKEAGTSADVFEEVSRWSLGS